MGTNYYHRTNICSCCGRYDETHIGKDSFGWQFSFQGLVDEEMKPVVSTYKEWKDRLLSGRIFDEYGREIGYQDFLDLVERSQSDKLNHYDYCVEHHPTVIAQCTEWKDNEGYSFTSTNFS